MKRLKTNKQKKVDKKNKKSKRQEKAKMFTFIFFIGKWILKPKKETKINVVPSPIANTLIP